MTDATSAKLDFSVDFIDLLSTVFIIRGAVNQVDDPWNLRDLTSGDNRGPAALLLLQGICQKYGL